MEPPTETVVHPSRPGRSTGDTNPRTPPGTEHPPVIRDHLALIQPPEEPPTAQAARLPPTSRVTIRRSKPSRDHPGHRRTTPETRAVERSFLLPAPSTTNIVARLAERRNISLRHEPSITCPLCEATSQRPGPPIGARCIGTSFQPLRAGTSIPDRGHVQ